MFSVGDFMSNKIDNHQEKKCSDECRAHHAIDRESERHPIVYSTWQLSR